MNVSCNVTNIGAENIQVTEIAHKESKHKGYPEITQKFILNLNFTLLRSVDISKIECINN